MKGKAPRTVRIGRYRLESLLGHGGMAAVYRAVIEGPQGFSRPCVVKRILPHLATEDAFVQMLVGEARVCGLLRHPNIVQVIELGEVDGEFFIAMEHVDGRPLQTVMYGAARTELPMPVGVACHLVNEVAAGLAYAHALTDDDGRPLSIVHRDVTHSNIMVTVHGGAKLLDFGIAKAAAQLQGEQTRVGVVKGKVSYLAPEQLAHLPLDRRVDIFSLGVVFWECLTGRRLFGGAQDSLDTMRLLQTRPIPAPSALRSGIDPAVDAVALKMLARDREQRYATCDDVVEALEPLVRAHGGSPREVQRFIATLEERERGLTAEPGNEPTPMPDAPAERHPRLSEEMRAVVADDDPFGDGSEEEAIPTMQRMPVVRVAAKPAPTAAAPAPTPPSTAAAPPGPLATVKMSKDRVRAAVESDRARAAASSTADTGPAPAVPRSWLPLVAVVLVTAGLTVAGGLWLVRRGAHDAAAHAAAVAGAASSGGPPGATGAPPSTAASVAPPGAPAAPARVPLRVEGTAEAEVSIDGQPVGRIPVTVEVARDDERHLVLVKRRGYRGAQQTFIADAPQTLHISLERAPHGAE